MVHNLANLSHENSAIRVIKKDIELQDKTLKEEGKILRLCATFLPHYPFNLKTCRKQY